MTEKDKEQPTMTPQQQAHVDALKRSWQQRNEITERLGRIKTRLGVYSGKGGVGKTTIAVNLAVALAQQGHSVGLLDADIDCPNATRVIGATEPASYDNGHFVPPETFGVKVMSMAFFQENEEEAIIWRGPMVHNAISQFVQTTEWGDLDFLIVDLPPGTSDAPLTVMQVLKLDGFIVVTTSQELATLDAKRSINMIKKMELNILGVVENFSGDVFGSGAGEELAKEMDLPFLGRLELRRDYRDGSRPTILLSDEVRQEYERILGGVMPRLEALGKPAV
ncbi:MAG: Mrp/NBP35 family ATP-binding protein [Dehalococcoidia bacterium]